MSDDKYEMVSVPKKDTNAGRPKGKKKYVVLFNWNDIDEYERNPKGVLVTKFSFKPGKKPIGVYATDKSIKINHSSEGDKDAKGFIHNTEFEHPGTELEIDEFLNNNINEDLGSIVFSCSGQLAKIAGTPCTPQEIDQTEGQDDNEADKTKIVLKSSIRGNTIGRIDKSLIPKTGNAEIDTALGLTSSGSGSGGL